MACTTSCIPSAWDALTKQRLWLRQQRGPQLQLWGWLPASGPTGLMSLARSESSSVESSGDILELIHIYFAGILDEKAAATQALGLYAKAMLELYGPHVERTLGVLQRMAGYFHDDVREQAYNALAYLVAATAKAFPSLAPGKLISSAGAPQRTCGSEAFRRSRNVSFGPLACFAQRWQRA